MSSENPYESLNTDLKTSVVGRNIVYYDQVPSTMDIAREQARQDAVEGTAIIAGEQLSGRGRKNKPPWLSPPGNIALSVILYPEVTNLTSLIMIASLSVVRSVRRVTGLEADIKWPNDVLIGGKKVAGILIENEITGDKIARAVIGIGINIDIQETIVEGSSLPVTSLEKETGRSVDKVELVKETLAEMDRLYSVLPDTGEIFLPWQKKLVTLGKRVLVTSGSERFEGTAESVESDGTLAIRLDDGDLITVVAGDVTLRNK